MDAAEVRKAAGRAFASHAPISVEWQGCEIQIRSRLSVGDAEQILPTLSRFAEGDAPMGEVCMKLFAVLAQGTDGKPLVEDGDDAWLRKCGDSGDIIKTVEKSGVLQKVLDAFAPGDGDEAGEGKPKA